MKNLKTTCINLIRLIFKNKKLKQESIDHSESQIQNELPISIPPFFESKNVRRAYIVGRINTILFCIHKTTDEALLEEYIRQIQYFLKQYPQILFETIEADDKLKLELFDTGIYLNNCHEN